MKSLKHILLFVLALLGAALLASASVPVFAGPVRVVPNSALSSSSPAASTYDWPQFDFNSAHSGNDNLETRITKGNVNTLQVLFQVGLPDIADGAPVYLRAVTTPSGVKDLVFVTTRDGHILARSADDGSPVWSKQYGPGACKINNGALTCYTTSSPVVDPNRRFVYSYGLDGQVHKYQVGDGTEVTSGGWPEVATLKGFDEKGSSALSVATDSGGASYLYVTNGGYPGDNGDYQGHITAVDLADGSQHVFNSMCSDKAVHFVEPGPPDCGDVQSAIWARAGVIFDSATNKVYMATGNGSFDPGKHYWGDTVFALNPNGTGLNGDPLDTFTTTNFQQLQNRDEDLGSSAPAILPLPANSRLQHVAVQGGKDAMLRILNLNNLSNRSGIGYKGGAVTKVIVVPQGGQILTQPAVWVNPISGRTWVFVANSNGISGLRLALNKYRIPVLRPIWLKHNAGTSPILANGVLFYAGSGHIWALDPTNGNILWTGTQIGSIHWESPIVANGVLYITDGSGNLTAYALKGAPPP
jgi:outer membrane protein assembly factor BamB